MLPRFHRALGAASLVTAAASLVPSRAGAQVTLVIRDEASAGETVTSAVDDALRDATGSSARRVEPTLDDLALAAGCAGDPSDAECVAAIASAAGARLVAIEHVETLPTGSRVRVDLRRGSDGVRLRTIVAECAPEACAEAMHAAMDRPTGTVLASVPAADAPLEVREERVLGARSRSRAVAATPDPGRGEAPGHARDEEVVEAPGTPRRGPSLDRTLLFGGAVLSSVAATIAGAVAVDFASTAGSLGEPDGREETERLAGLESRRDTSFGVASAFALAGAGLAIAGLLVPADGREPRVAPAPVAGLGAAVSLTVDF